QQKPHAGLLLSVRKFSSDQAYFKLGQKLMIVADKVYLEDNVGVFNCNIKVDNNIIATAKLNTYQPSKEKLKEILQGKDT
ncbi:MAG TPA: hypothetical protein VI522_02140, partial [Gammaproteobacteria bacterium]|nr:hypothetical protein [Gammaproteobacteria bacterium]